MQGAPSSCTPPKKPRDPVAGSKNIVLFIDGTGNDRETQTNVRRLYELCVKDGTQRKRYLRGVGTTPLAYRVGQLIEQGSGLGTAHRIRRSYTYLSRNYVRGDRVYLFGFSRGAFAVRSLAGFVDAVGLLLKRFVRTGLVEQAYDTYMRWEHLGHERRLTKLRAFLIKIGIEPKGLEGQELPIHFIGVWDSVAALGLPGTSYFNARHRVSEIPAFAPEVRHALSLHDLRRDFEPTLYRRAVAGKRLRQVWFAGAHADVGGGYDDGRDRSAIALTWMTDEAVNLGLIAKTDSGATVATLTPSHHIHHGCEARPWTWVTGNPRQALRHFDRLPAETLATFEVHQTSLRRLCDPNVAYDFDGDTNWQLRQVDTYTLRLHLRLCCGRTNDEADGSSWWQSATPDELKQAVPTLTRFMNPTNGLTRGLGGARRAMQLLMLCDECAMDRLEPALNRLHEEVKVVLNENLFANHPARNVWVDKLSDLRKTVEAYGRHIPCARHGDLGRWLALLDGLRVLPPRLLYAANVPKKSPKQRSTADDKR